ncbi:hypothetical protein TRVL_09077 [Trypanosoma vivax]|nr:hypothetical protein TRVL_09077 [Trypanosoma vivax]
MWSGKGEAGCLLPFAGAKKDVLWRRFMMARCLAVGSRAAGEMQAQAAHMAAGIPKAPNRGDALREARLKPISEVAHRRVLEYYLRLKAEGPAHAKVADSIFPPEHPIHVRLAKAQQLYSTRDDTEKPHDATVLQLARRVHFNTTTPGGLKADAPEKDK